jgi:hypothetical protein
MAIFEETVLDQISTQDVPTRLRRWFLTTTDTTTMFLPSGISGAYTRIVADVTTASDVTTFQVFPSGSIEELITLDDLAAMRGSYNKTASDRVTIAVSLQRPGLSALTVDALTISGGFVPVRTTVVREALGAVDVASGWHSWRPTLLESLVLEELHEAVRAATAIDTVAAGDAAQQLMVARQLLVDTIVASELLLPWVSAITAVTDAVTTSDSIDWRWVFSALTAESLRMRGGITIPVADPGTGTTWAVNARTGGVTEYRNFAFNSFAPSGNKYLGANADGLFELNGDTDDGDDIIAHVRSGFFQLGGSRFSSIKTAYLGMHAEGKVYLRILLGEGRLTTYRVTAKPMQTTKVPMGKGLRTRYFAFEFESVGQDFDLDAVEFVPLVMERRV